MPIIFVYGTPASVAGHVLERLLESLQHATAGVTELQLKPEEVTVLFPPDRVDKGLGEEIIIMVEGLYECPDRTVVVLNTLAEKCGQTVLEYFPKALVECFVRTVNPVAGIWTKNHSRGQAKDDESPTNHRP